MLVSDVFPACAGMFLETFVKNIFEMSFPRVRGDVPSPQDPNAWFARFSPRARGCSFSDSIFLKIGVVFPACAGMFPALNPKN